jgi:hypothetical protein
MFKIFEAQALQCCQTDSEDEEFEEEYAQIRANLAEHSKSPLREHYHTPDQTPRSSEDHKESSPDIIA